MEAIFFLLSVACIVYFIIIVVYSGIGTAFCGVWIALAVVFALMGYFCIHSRRRRGGLPRRLPVFVFTSFFLAVGLFAFVMNLVVKEAVKAPQEGLSYVVVLGARVYPDRLSNTLKKRLDKAYAYYLENPGTRFVLSGGRGRDEVVPEAMAMYNYLHLQGIPEKNLLIEISSTSTKENLQYSARLIAEDKKRHYVSTWPKPMQIGILTSDFHVMRAVGIAKNLGYQNVSGIAAPSDSLLFLHSCVRECAAVVKDYLAGNLV